MEAVRETYAHHASEHVTGVWTDQEHIGSPNRVRNAEHNPDGQEGQRKASAEHSLHTRLTISRIQRHLRVRQGLTFERPVHTAAQGVRNQERSNARANTACPIDCLTISGIWLTNRF